MQKLDPDLAGRLAQAAVHPPAKLIGKGQAMIAVLEDVQLYRHIAVCEGPGHQQGILHGYETVLESVPDEGRRRL